MADKHTIIKKAKKTLRKYICQVAPLTPTEKEELRMRIKLAIQDFD